MDYLTRCVRTSIWKNTKLNVHFIVYIILNGSKITMKKIKPYSSRKNMEETRPSSH